MFEGCFRALVVTRMSLPIRAIVNFVTKDPEVFLGAARNVRTLFCPPKQGQKGKIPQMLSKQRGRTQEFLLSHVLYSMKLIFFILPQLPFPLWPQVLNSTRKEPGCLAANLFREIGERFFCENGKKTFEKKLLKRNF